MKISDLTKEHPKTILPKTLLKSQRIINVITPTSNGKRARKLDVRRYAGVTKPIINVLSDEVQDRKE